MSLLVNIIILFIIGFLQDILAAYYLRLVNEQRPLFATFISFIHNIVGWGVWVWFIYQFKNPDYQMSGLDAVANSLGASVGTYLGLRKPGESPKSK